MLIYPFKESKSNEFFPYTSGKQFNQSLITHHHMLMGDSMATSRIEIATCSDGHSMSVLQLQNS